MPTIEIREIADVLRPLVTPYENWRDNYRPTFKEWANDHPYKANDDDAYDVAYELWSSERDAKMESAGIFNAGMANNTFEILDGSVRYGSIYDCRALNVGFVQETGADRLAELQDRNEVPSLHECMAFEFTDMIVTITEGNWLAPETDLLVALTKENSSSHLIVHAIPLPFVLDDAIDGQWLDANTELWSKIEWDRRLAQYNAHDGEDQFGPYEGVVSQCGGDDDELYALNSTAVRRALGMLVLLEERLLIDKPTVHERDISNNAKRKRNGIAPLPPYHVVTLNLAETKRRTRHIALRMHESPHLHWRRGHWRTLHRLSEFEKRIWVRRCLVGDASKDFIPKHYRPIWQPTVH